MRTVAVCDLLLVTDLDNTLVGDRKALKQLNSSLEVLRSRLKLTYATGRSLLSARKLQQVEGLLEPDGWATGVGSSLLWCGQPDPAWDARLLVDWDRPALADLFDPWDGLVPQDHHEQSSFKLSYNLLQPLQGEAALAFEAKVHNTLQQHGQRAQVVFSSGFQLDLLPLAAGKGAVVAHLQQKLGLAEHQVLCCGDSGNDRSMLSGPWWGVMVSNATAELQAWWEQARSDTLVRATRPYAGAISEALETLPLL